MTTAVSLPEIDPPADANADIWEGSPPERCVFADPRCALNSTADGSDPPSSWRRPSKAANGSGCVHHLGGRNQGGSPNGEQH